MGTRSLGLFALILSLIPPAAAALTTAFTWQGRLTQAGAAATGSYDFQCKLYDAVTSGTQVGSTLTLSGVAVANGLYTVSLDFGSAPFAGADRWLAVAVRATGGASYTPLSPRQPLRPAPYALFARAVHWDGILGRPAAFGVYTAGDGLTLTGQAFSVAVGGITAAMLADDPAGLARVSGNVISSREEGIAIGPGNIPVGPLFQVCGYEYTPMGIEQTSANSAIQTASSPWQSFTADASTTLKAIEVFWSPAVRDAGAVLTIYAGEGTAGAVLGTQAVTIEPNYGYHLFTLDTPVALTAGNVYTFGFTFASSACFFYFRSGNPYPGGQAWFDAAADLYFRLYSARGSGSRTALAIERDSLNVGIGNSAPGFPLAFASENGDKIGLSGQSGSHYGFGVQYHQLQIHTDSANSDIIFGYGQSGAMTETVRFTGNGKVGIGTSSPSYKLHVNGSVAGVGAYVNLSDARFKTNIRPLVSALTKIGRLQGVEFDWKRDGTSAFCFDDAHQLGFLAQEVEKVVPEAVTKGPDGIYSMSYSTLIPLLVEGMKEQQGQIATLRQENAGFKADKAVLQARLDALEALVREMRATPSTR